MKKKIIITLVALALIGMCAYGGAFLIYQSRINAITLDHPPFENLADGLYEGHYNAIFVQAKVSVAVQNQQVTKIDLIKHVNDRGEKGPSVMKQVIRAQSTDVETVSGATNSSQVILKAIENAVEEGAN